MCAQEASSSRTHRPRADLPAHACVPFCLLVLPAALSDILLQVVDAANYVITDVPFINIGVMVLRGTIDRLKCVRVLTTHASMLVVALAAP